MSPRTLSPEVEFWQRLSDAADEPEQANIPFLLVCLEQLLVALPLEKQLTVAGGAIAQIAQIYEQRTNQQLDEWEEAYREGDLLMADDLLYGLVQKTKYLDLSELTRQPNLRQRKWTKPQPDDSVVGVVDKKTMLSVVESFEEQKRKALEAAEIGEVSVWVSAIASFYKQHRAAISLSKLQQAVKLPLVEVWLGLLLGGYEMEQRGEFYDAESIAILGIQSSENN